MKSNSKTVQPRKTSHLREFLWIVYKWSLIGLCMYVCYRLLLSEFDYLEFIPCIAITIVFGEIIKYHTMLKKNAETPGSSSLGKRNHPIGSILSAMMYTYLYFYSAYLLRTVNKQVLVVPYTLFAIIMYIVVPVLFITLFVSN